MKVLFFGDIVGKPGRRGLAKLIPEIKKEHKPHLILGNIENAAHGKGITEKVLRDIASLGLEVFTSGEHIYDKSDDEKAQKLFTDFPTLLKPANFAPQRPGRGEVLVETDLGQVLVISLIGQVFFRHENLSPWEMLPEILERQKIKPVAVIVDFHAEATSEKVAFGRHYDGLISALLGTHTHIPTADAQILPGGTAYVTDVGMNGPKNSVLGMKADRSIERFLTGEMVAYDIADGPEVWLNYVIMEIDTTTGQAVDIQHFHQTVNI